MHVDSFIYKLSWISQGSKSLYVTITTFILRYLKPTQLHTLLAIDQYQEAYKTSL